MKLHILLLVTHAAAAGIVGGLVGLALIFGFGWAWIGVLFLAAIAVLVAGWWPAWQIRRGLKLLDRALAKRGQTQGNSSGIHEFDRAAARLAEYAQRLDEVTASGREQSREVDSLLRVLDRRTSGKTSTMSGPAGFQLRHLLAGIGGVLHNNLSQMVQCIDEIGRCTQEIATGAETQGNSVGKATSSVEQIASNVVTVNSKAEQARESFLHARSLAEETLRDVRELIRSLERMRINAESSEKKLRALGDHSHEISAIVETIGEIASRTDMLALNASIESVRAGEHGKGFAVVAEEVRKLAEQATHATREVAGLLETIRLEAQESISGISQERVQIENEVARVTTAGEALGKIGDLADDSAARVQEVLTSAQQQSRLVEDVLSTVDLIRNVTKMSRKRSERACWMVNAISKNTRAFGNSLSPLRRCSDGYVDELEADSTSDFPLSMGAADMRTDQRIDQRPGDEDLMDDARNDLNSLNLDSDPDSAGNLRSRDLADVH